LKKGLGHPNASVNVIVVLTLKFLHSVVAFQVPGLRRNSSDFVQN